ncbi:MAG: PEP-CTERM sorting domain-containing protein, partial [Phycisphaerae bacterium]
VEPGRTLEVAGTLTVGAAGTLNANGGTIVADALDVTAGGAFSDTSSSMLRVNALVGFGDAIWLHGDLALGHAGGSGAGTHAVGPGQSLSTEGGLYVAYDGTGTLSIAGGGAVSNNDGCIGFEPNSHGTVTVDGNGSTWTNSGGLYVGEEGSGTLTIAGGGLVSNTWAYIGYEADSNGTVTVDRNGSTWTNCGSLTVGLGGSGTLMIAGGGLVSNADGYIGRYADSNGTVTVDGAGSTWTNSGNVDVGYFGTGTLIIAGGGAVSNRYGSIAWLAGSNGTVTVDGNGSTWTNRANLDVGYRGTGTLTIAGGGAVSDSDAYIGLWAGSNGTVTVRDPCSTWTNSGSLYVGYEGSGTLTIAGGGGVSNDCGYIAYEPDSTGTVTVAVTVDGAGSTWTNYSFLSVGDSGTGMLTIAGGGAVSNTVGYIGHCADSNGTVTVRDPGSTWTNSGGLYVGYEGTGMLAIAGGGAVWSDLGHVGSSPGSTGTVTVDGAGSTWTNDRDLLVGDEGSGMLAIAGGGVVSNDRGFIGCSAGSTGTVTVDGAGSTWTTSEALLVGFDGSGTLSIAGGGTVLDTDGYIGCSAGSTGTVTVDGPGSTWANSGTLYVGGGSHNGGTGSLTVADGGRVEIGGVLRLWPDGIVNLHGGLLRFAQGDPLDPCGGTLGFHYGTVEFDRDLAITGSNGTLRELFGWPITIPGAKTLSVTGTATLAAQVTLDGGTLSAADLVNGSLLQCNGGTLKLTGADLLVGPAGQFGWALTVPSAQTIDVTHTATVASDGQLSVAGGRLAAGEMVNLGQIELAGPPSVISASTLTNHGFVHGDGTIAAALNNQATGQVSVAAGQRLRFVGAGNANDGAIISEGGKIELSGDLTNTGQVDVTNGTFRAGEPVTNTAAGSISGRGDATLRFDGGLDNSGIAGVSFASAAIYGDILNNADAILSIAGASTATFAGDLTNNGSVFIGADSRAVFQGHVGGGGSFPGGGTAEFVDGFSPGGSAGSVAFGGHVTFESSAVLNVELADDDNSDPLAPRYDALDVAGDVDLAGALSVEWLPIDGDPNSKFGGVYDILSFGGTRMGIFDGVDCQMAAYLDTSLFADGIEYDDANGVVKIHLYDLLEGDADLDGRVARDDFHALQLGFGSPDADWFTGDFNFDGRVDFLDYLTWKANVGDAVPGAVPEPATLLLICGAAAPALLKRRRRG